MPWRRYGQVYAPRGDKEWSCTHAALPTPVQLDGYLLRFFFSTRDAAQRSSVSWVDIDLEGVPRVVAEAQFPALSFGSPGMFDDSGIGVGSFVPDGRKTRLYYMGWNLGVTAPWRNSIGIARGYAREGRFERLYEGPILDRSPKDPFTLSYPWVHRLAQNDWVMWYGSNTQWGARAGDMHHVLKSARSSDGLTWSQQEPISIGPEVPGEYAFARPSVIREGASFRMWFAVRGERYRIGYAESKDGKVWVRADGKFGLAPSELGWESEMTCYPCAFKYNSKLYLAYNGNGYGRTGFGLAVWED